jgi:hypothetical protein
MVTLVVTKDAANAKHGETKTSQINTSVVDVPTVH